LFGDIDGYSQLDIFVSRLFDGFVYAFVPAFVSLILQPSDVSFFFFPEKAILGAKRAWAIQVLKYFITFFAQDFFAERLSSFLVGKEYFIAVWVYNINYFVYSVGEDT
jgi:hypothetical protein